MGIVADVLAALETLPLWKRIKPLPERVDELERRIAELESRSGSASVGGLQQCPLCNSMQFKRVESKPDRHFGRMGVMSDTYRCLSCQHQEDRKRNEGAR